MSTTQLNTRIRFRTDTTINWSTNNPILLKGELGFDSDLLKIKIGNGSSNWNALTYCTLTPDEIDHLIITNSGDFYNVTINVPLSNGYYNIVSAISAIPSSNLKKGMTITFEVSNGVWNTYQHKSGVFTTYTNWEFKYSTGGNGVMETTLNPNNIIISGDYLAENVASNTPSSSKYWYVTHIASFYNTNNAYQKFIELGSNSPLIYERYKVSGSWTTFKAIPNIELVDSKLDTDGSASNTTIDFTEAESSILPITGESQSVLWGKILRFLHVDLNNKVNSSGGNISLTETVGNRSTYTWDTAFPSSSTLQSIGNYIGRIIVKLEYIYNNFFGKNDVDLYNITVKVPLGSGYYTLSSAIAAVDSAIRKKGFILCFESESNVFQTWQFKNLITNWTTESNWEMLSITNQNGNIGIVSNLNTISSTGNYTAYGTATGVPSSSYSWFIQHNNSSINQNSAYQKAIAYTADLIYERKKTAGVWGNWTLSVTSTALAGKLDITGYGGGVRSDSSDSSSYETNFPSEGTSWTLNAWFGLIKTKINHIMTALGFAPSVLTITAIKTGSVITYNDFNISEWYSAVENFASGKNIKINYSLSDNNDDILENVYYNANYNIKTGTIDCQDLGLSFYVDETEGTSIISSIGGYLRTNGNGSETTVNFAEAGSTALPASGEKQSTLWGKALRYFKTEIPAWLSAKIDIQGGDATNAVSASNDSITYDQTWPTYVTKWSLLNWFGAIRAKLDYLFGKRALILNVTATRALPTDDWTFGTFSTTEFTAIAAIASNGAPIYVRFSGTTNGVAEPVMMYPGLWNETLQQITSRDLARGFYLNGGVATNRGARSYDTQKYIDLGANFNNTTGYYEYLGLTDITEAECREAYYLTGSKFAAPVNFYLYGSLRTRFLFPITNNSSSGTLINAFNQCTGIQRVRLCKNPNIADGVNNLYYSTNLADMCKISSVRYISGGINVNGITTASNLVAFTNTNMMHILLYNLKVNLNLAASSSIDEESILCAIVNRANGTTNITITLHPTAYAMALASTSIQAALVGSYITLASA